MTTELKTYAQAVCDALSECARRDPSVLLLAEGVDDPSAVFGTLRGIQDVAAPDQLIEMPVAENGLMGVAVGAALMGKRPVISFHRVEFALLAMEQIVNNAAKMHYITGGMHQVPLVVRAVVGRGWGQGPEHSQSLETLFAHIPGLKVIMPSYPVDAKRLLQGAVEDPNPVICIEHRWCHYASGEVPTGYVPELLSGPRVIRSGGDLTIVSTSYMTLEAARAAAELENLGFQVELIDLRVLRPLNLDPVFDSVRQTGRLLTVDTGFRTLGIGAEIVSRVAESCFDALKAPPRRLGLPDHPTPSSRGLVPGFYPDAARILDDAGQMLGVDADKLEASVRELRQRRDQLPVDVPDPFFKGPF